MISVIIPSYNRATKIKRSMESVLSQTYENLELIIVDDGSTDNTKEVVDSVNDDRVRYILQKNQGACAARNLGIENAVGNYIAFQDSDDAWDKRKLERQLKILEEHSDVDIVCCKTKCALIDGSVRISKQNDSEGIISKEVGPYDISTQTLLMRKKVVEEIKFDPNVTRFQDLDFLLRAMESFKLYFVPDVLVERFIGNDSITNHPERTYQMAVYFVKKYGMNFCMERSLSRYFSGWLIEAGRMIGGKHAGQYYRMALKMNPTLKCMIKIVMVTTGLYPVYRKLVNKMIYTL